jgi:galactokinase/mevalonate kinase-like predicted kinase
MRKEEIKMFASWLGKRSYKARVARLGIERIREIARENGKKGGRPRKARAEEKPKEIGV